MKLLNSFKAGIIYILLAFTLYNCDNDEHSSKKIIVSDGLMAYFPFNENAFDESGNNNNGIVNGATLTTDRNEIPDLAYYFDGTSDIQIPNPSFFNNMDSFSICAWVYPTEIKYRHNTIISKVNPNRDFNIKILEDNKKYEAHFAHGANYFRCYSNDTIELNKWTHVVYQWTGTQWKLYMNGIFEKISDPSEIAPLWTDTIMAIGSMNKTEFFTGKIDNIRIYNRILSAEEIDLIYNDKE